MSGHVQYSSLAVIDLDNPVKMGRAPHPRTSAKEVEGGSFPDPSYSRSKAIRDRGVVFPIMKPISILLLGVLLALGHHLFNLYAEGKSVDFLHSVPQVWMNRIGTAFAVGFKSALTTALSFVLYQVMWLTLRGKFMTFSEIDRVYLVAYGDVVATFFSSNLFKNPMLVIIAALSFLLPIPTVLTPSSLRVTPVTITQLGSPCQVPTGNLTNGGPGSTMYLSGGWGYWTGITPVAQKLAFSTFMGQRILSLPQPCGSNCTFSVSIPSIAFRCQEGVQLPAGMAGTPGMVWDEPFWNATTSQDPTLSPDPNTSFYVFWKSTTQSGTNGTALCTVGTAQYDFTVRTTNGQEIVTYNVTHTGDLVNTQGPNDTNLSMEQWTYALQLSSIAAATRSLLLGTVSIMHGASTETPKFDSSIISAAFFDTSLNSGQDFTWGDVAGGIEQLSHNVSAAILTMDLGLQNSTCSVSRQDIVYEYDRLNLWLPYGVALLIVSLCLVLGIMVFLRINSENLTPSFSDTVGLTRNSSLDAFARGDDEVADRKRRSLMMRFRLGELKDGGTGFGMREDLKSE